MGRWKIHMIAIAIGALAGWAWWNWYGCASGCGITGQWWSSTAYGGVMGYLLLGLVLPAGKRKRSEASDEG
ncbi:MAG: hypothetical protein KIT10_14090 [Flavobacteriales bacterium]|nr:hypothetical protein [Flavobacteriales bacterium]